MCADKMPIRNDVNHAPASGDDVTEEAVRFLSEGTERQDATQTEEGKPVYKNICDRLKHDEDYLKTLCHTVWLCWSFVTLGCLVGQMGPTFPDLRLIVNQDLDSASWLFTTFSIGYLVGSLVGGVLFDKFNKLLLICFSVLGMAVTSGILPWCDQFPLMLTVRFLSGVFAGGLDTGGNADMVAIWDEKEGRPYMQALHFCFGFGGIIAPLVSRPFLAVKECLPVGHDVSTSEPGNMAASRNVTTLTVPIQANDTESNITGSCVEQFGETRVHISYLISAIFVASAAVPFLIVYLKRLRQNSGHGVHEKTRQPTRSRPDKIPLNLKIILLFLLAFMMLTYCAVEDTYAGFLMTFSLRQLKWSKSTGSLATSLYWAAFSVGRFCGIFLVGFFKPVTLLCSYCIFLMTSLLGLFISIMTNFVPLVWLFIPLAGFSMSVIFPCIFTWTEERILKVTGKISSIFLISASGGLMLNPLFIGYLMKHYGPMWFLYLLLGESVLCFLLFVTIFNIVRAFVRPIHQRQMSVTLEGQPLAVIANHSANPVADSEGTGQLL